LFATGYVTGTDWLKVDAGTIATVRRFVIAPAGSCGESGGYNTRDLSPSQDALGTMREFEERPEAGGL